MKRKKKEKVPIPTLAKKNLTSKRPPLSKYKRSDPTDDANRDTDVMTTLVEITPQARQTFDAIYDGVTLQAEIQEVEDERARVHEENEAAKKKMEASLTQQQMNRIEIAPTETGKCIACFQGRSTLEVSRLCLARVLVILEGQFCYRSSVWRCIRRGGGLSTPSTSEAWYREAEGQREWWY